MTPMYDINEKTVLRLQKHSIPLVDDINSVINKMADAYETLLNSTAPLGASDKPILEYSPLNPPDLSFTRLTAVTIDGKALTKKLLWWNPTMFEVIRRAADVAKKDEVLALLDIKVVKGKTAKDEYIEALDSSVQGQSANYAWKTILNVAKALKINVELEFVWEDRPGLANAGKAGRLKIVH